MALQRNWDPRGPHGERVGAGDGLYLDENGNLAVEAGWGIIVTEDGVAVDQAVLDERYIDVVISTEEPTLAGVKIWIDPDAEAPDVVDPATQAAINAMRVEMDALRRKVAGCC